MNDECTVTTPPASSSGLADAELARVLDAYLASIEAGDPLDADALATEHPAIADRLRACLASLQLVEETAGRLAAARAEEGPDGAPITAEPTHGALGDFRIIREVGRGGMGVVYEAEQVSLGRRVALKVLPFAATMDARQLQRFKNEAHAAAQLHHTNIVPVYFVGCERGVHYYAMQFIEGHSLADVIAALKKTHHEDTKDTEKTRAYVPSSSCSPCLRGESSSAPSTAVALTTDYSSNWREYYRKVAELGIQAAEALDFAHDHGILHRDIKPANLLVDAESRLWVTDFGLAQVQSDTRLTLTGDLVGTLRYMSPEQALAKRVVVDHRTDVYSLGATLYELLTLEPAFTGTDRQELLRQIAFEEPRRPRRVNRAIPAELETIVLKALEKNPAERYGAAKELADDLRHFLEDKPIRARPPSLAKRIHKWTRRHKALTWSAAVVLLTTALFGGGSWLAWEQKRVANEREVDQAIREALSAKSQGNLPGALSAIQRAVSLQAANSVSPELHARVLEVQADFVMLFNLESIPLETTAVEDNKFDTRQRVNAYARAFREYGIDCEALETDEAAARIRRTGIAQELAAALTDWALILDRKKEDRSWKRLLLIAREADHDAWSNELRDMYQRWDPQAARRLAATVSITDAPPTMLRDLGNLLKLMDAVPEAIDLLRKAAMRYPADFWTNVELAGILCKLDPPKWDDAHRHYLAALAIRPKNAGAWLNVGYALQHRGERAEAKAAYEEAINLKSDYVEAYLNLGNLHYDNKEFAEAIRAYRLAIDHDPRNASAYYNLGNSLAGKGAALEEVIQAYENAVSFNAMHHKAWVNLGIAYGKKGELDKAIHALGEGVRTDDKSARAHLNLGSIQYLKRALDDAIVSFNRAIELQGDLAEAHGGLGTALADKGLLKEGILALKKAGELNPKSEAIQHNLALILERANLLNEATVAWSRAVELNPKSADYQFRLGY
ncbi:MAG TPA: serine/threonine-protein kinase, partial [Gemmataceae bacterium]|nr:serine/threonine-protein kinase [Gemmataceae bacterium]